MKERNNLGIALFVLIHLAVAGHAQPSITKDSICWCREYKVKWSDFQGILPEQANWKAVSGIYIKAQGYWEGQFPNYNVINFFLRKYSWAKDTASINLLDHERLHFDIGEIYARKIRSVIDSLRRKEETRINTYTEEIDSLLDQWEQYGNAYDQETSHGLRPSKQEEWAIKIQKELSALEKYATKCPPKYTIKKASR